MSWRRATSRNICLMRGPYANEAPLFGHFSPLIHRWQAQRRGPLDDDPTVADAKADKLTVPDKLTVVAERIEAVSSA